MLNQKITMTSDELAEQYLQGKTLAEIANMFGASTERVRQKLVNGGYVIRDLKTKADLRQTKYKKCLIDEVLLESTNRQVQFIKKKARNFEIQKCNALQRLRKYSEAIAEIKVIAKDIIDNDVYENSDAKAEKILKIIEGVDGNADTKNL